MGKLTWLGWKTDASEAPQPTSIVYGSNLRAEASESRDTEEPQITEEDFVLELLKQANLPLTRDNYIGLAYPDGVPEDFDEGTLPPEIKD